MLSGRYHFKSLVWHWKPGSNGNCLLAPSCTVLEDIPHILQHCPAYQETRNKLQLLTNRVVAELPEEITAKVLSLSQISSPFFCNFLLDCSTIPDVISAVQRYGEELLQSLFYLTQSWIFAIHTERLKLRGLQGPAQN